MLGLQPAVHYLVGIIHEFESLAFVTSLTPFAFVLGVAPLILRGGLVAGATAKGGLFGKDGLFGSESAA